MSCFLIDFQLYRCELSCTGFRKANIFRDLNPLALQKLTIPSRDNTGRIYTSGSKSTSETPKSLRRAGNFLLLLLRVQYKQLETPIAGLRVVEAYTRLQEQIIKYQKVVYPFERPLGEKETAGEWWANLDKDKSNDAQPLAVIISFILLNCLIRT